MNNLHSSKLNSASQLILGMEGLLPGDRLPISQAARKDAGTLDEAANRQRFAAALTRTVLYSIVVELVVKHIWEREHGKTAPYHHNVHGLFEQLTAGIQGHIVALYDACAREYKKAIQAGQAQHGPESVAVEMANLEEALQWNKEAVKNFKYEMKPNGRSVPTGMIWDSDHIWIVPGDFPNFAIELTRWADRRGL